MKTVGCLALHELVSGDNLILAHCENLNVFVFIWVITKGLPLVRRRLCETLMCCTPLLQCPCSSSSLNLAACSARGWDVVLIPLTFFCVLVSLNKAQQQTNQPTNTPSSVIQRVHSIGTFILENDHGKIQAAKLPGIHSMYT